MSDIYLKRIDSTLLYPPFLEKYRVLLTNCEKRGAIYYATNGLRSYKDQEKLYSYGRTDKTRGIVTKAPPGYSAHNYGVAADSCRDGDPGKEGLQPNWNIKEYAILAEEAKKLGLDAAYYWQNFKEGPHVQLDIKKQGITWPTLIAIIKKKGISGVFAYLNTFKW